ncbi:hypothetical protein R1sor_006505 [Riccia sorocarpa]|uniref:CCHC-type domain-containing protein n=1 Tax=Riccia sorocarpa TaxID=122646 RepID=A0ABD3HU17_9MARC
MSVWKERDPKKPYYEIVEARTANSSLAANWHGVPIAPGPVHISLPKELTDTLFNDTYSCRLVLSFQDKLKEKEAREWILAFNASQDSQRISYERPLRNLLHLVKIPGRNPQEVHKHLIEEEVLHHGDSFATINEFTADFDDAKPTKLKQIVIVLIPDADDIIYRIADYILQPIGVLLHKFVVLQNNKATLRAVTLTDKSYFHTEIIVALQEQSLRILLEYEGLHLRCYICGVCSHIAEDCPTRFGPPPSEVLQDLNLDPMPSTRQVQQQSLHTQQDQQIPTTPNEIDLIFDRARSTEDSQKVISKTSLPQTLGQDGQDSEDRSSKEDAYRILVGKDVPPQNLPRAPRYVPPSRVAALHSTAAGPSNLLQEASLPAPPKGEPPPSATVDRALQPKPHSFKVYAALKPRKPSIEGGFVSPPRTTYRGQPRNRGNERFERGRQPTEGALKGYSSQQRTGHGQQGATTQSGKGGVLLLYAPWIKEYINQTGLLPREAGIWISLKDQTNLELGVAAIYAPNSSALRTQIWSDLADFLDPALKWTLMGDFNMTLSQTDHLRGTGTPIAGEERSAWNNLQGNLFLRDTFIPKRGKIHFSWDNRRKILLQDDQRPLSSSGQMDPTQTEGMILKRLDRIHVHQALLDRPFTSNILPGHMLSDHLPVTASLQFGNSIIEGRSRYRINVDLLQDRNLQDKIKLEWNQIEAWHLQNGSQPDRIYRACIKRTVSICRHWGKVKADQKKQVVAEIRLRIQTLTCHLQYTPHCHHTQTELHYQQVKLHAIEVQKAKWAESLLRDRWDKDGDRCSKTFFAALKQRKQKIAVHDLTDDDGTNLTGEQEKVQWAHQFFSKLLQRLPDEQDENQATNQILLVCKTKVSDSQRETLENDYTL